MTTNGGRLTTDESAETTEADAVVSENSLPESPSEYIPVLYIKRSASMLIGQTVLSLSRPLLLAELMK
jgi:hypothetical protein